MRRGEHQQYQTTSYSNGWSRSTSTELDNSEGSFNNGHRNNNGLLGGQHSQYPHHRHPTSSQPSVTATGVNPMPMSGAVTRNAASMSSPSISTISAVPGRPRRKTPLPPIGSPSAVAAKRPRRQSSFCHRFYVRWIERPMAAFSTFSSLFVAVMLWYLLGVASIGTSKILLTGTSSSKGAGGAMAMFGSVPPLFLTLQQLFIGSTLLRFLLNIRFLGSPGLQPWPPTNATNASPNQPGKHKGHRNTFQSRQQQRAQIPRLLRSLTILLSYPHIHLVLSGIYFSLGFFVTNYSFQQSSAAFVETVKAAEPITSAAVAVAWGIETLSQQESASLLCIVLGVLLSTLGSSKNGNGASGGVADSLRSCWVVMTANLFFSFRGLQQKLFRASPHGTTQVVDDLNLQYRMQQLGVAILLIPVMIFEMPSLINRVWTLSVHIGLLRSGMLQRYVGLALVNGFAFASYNLASTYILSRISVVHHAALNCIRRIFAIVVTSILFGLPITFTGGTGILVSFGGFMAFTHYKVQRQRQPKPLSSLLPSASTMSNSSTSSSSPIYGGANAV